jgi:hypothetical protein
MARQSFIQQFIDGEWVMVPKDQVLSNARPTQTHYVIGDINPYRSTIDGSVIGSRSTHRAHLKQHGCVEVGNEKQKPYQAPKLSNRERVDDIRRAIQHARSRGMKLG